jgi:SAM-dependent methyltransferase
MGEKKSSRETPGLTYTGERHMIAQPGIDLSLGHIDHMIRYASVSPFVVGKRVLDIACGSGYGSQFLALQGADHVVGVDIDRATIEYAQTCHGHPRVTYLRADAHAVPDLEEASFDVIVSFETIEHVQQPRDFLMELRRVLKPGGQCFISCPNDYRTSPWISEFHVNRFKFTEFCDLIVLVFGEAIFLGQHNTCTSSLLKPRFISEHHGPFEAYKQPLPAGFFGNQYLDSLSPIENAAGYFAVVGVDSSSCMNHLSVSESSFQQMLTGMHFYSEETKKAQQETGAVKQEIAELRQQMEAEKSLRAELEVARVQELGSLRQKLHELETARAQELATLQHKLQELEAARAQTIATLQQKLQEQDTVRTQELATLRQKLQEQDSAHVQTIATLQQKLQEQEIAHVQTISTLQQKLQEQEIAHAQRIAALHEPLQVQDSANRLEVATLQQKLQEQDAARAQETAMLTEQMRAESEHHSQERMQAEQQLSDRIELVRVLQQERARAESLAQGLRARIAAMESSKFWKLRRIWFHLKGTIGLKAE